MEVEQDLEESIAYQVNTSSFKMRYKPERYNLEISNLRKSYDGFSLNNVTFKLPEGSIMGLIGENGAGKSTIINLILGTIQKEGGVIKLFGNEMTDQDKKLRENIGVVYSDPCFYEKLNAQQISKIMQGIFARWDSKLFENYLERFKISNKKLFGQLSKGTKMKLLISTALAHKPKLLILDEATSGLDVIVRDEILDLFYEFVQEPSHSILISSHITSDLEKIADYITFIDNGNIILSKKKDEIIYNYGVVSCNTDYYNRIDKSDMVAYFHKDYGWEILVDNATNFKEKYPDCVVERASLDEIMLFYLKGEKR